MATNIDVSDWIDRQRISALQVRLLVLCGACALVEGLDAQIIGYVAPAIIHDWNVPAQSLTAVFMSGLTGLLIGCLVVAPLADHFGRKTILVGTVTSFGIFSLLTATSTDLFSLGVWRFLTGLGIGGGMANAIALTYEFFPRNRRSTMTVVMFAGFPVGATVGGFVAVELIARFGWPSVFVCGGVLPLVLAALLLTGLPESVRHLVAHARDQRRVATILRRINPRSAFPDDARFVIDEEHHGGFTVGYLFRDGRAIGTVLIWIVFFMSLFDIFLVASWLPTILHDARLSISTSVLITAMVQGCGVVACLLIAPLLDDRHCLRVLLPAYLVSAIGIAALGSVGTGLVPLLAAASVAGCGIVGGQVTANAFAAAYYPTYIRATGVGWALGVGRVGAIAGPFIGGLMIAMHLSRQTIFLVGASAALIAAAAVIGLMLLQRSRATAGATLAT